MAHEPGMSILYVASPAASARFYSRLFGCDPVEASPTFVLFVFGSGVKFGLWARDGVLPAAGGAPGAAETAIQVGSAAEVDAIHAGWAADGLPILMPPGDFDFGRSFVVSDPDGHRLRVYALAD